jgi:Na+/proline symporter
MRGLNGLDFIVIVAYLVGITLLGMYVGRKQRDAKDYFVADREIPWWAVLFSIVASETSALTFISIPGLAYVGNLGFLQVATGYLVGRIALAYTLLPRYYEGNLVTAYALLEQRFGLATRRFTSIVFMVTRGMADSVRVFATAVPIALIIGPLLPAARSDACGRSRARDVDDSLYDQRRNARRWSGRRSFRRQSI